MEHDTAPSSPADTAQRTPAERAFDLFDAGKLGEAGLLAAVGVSRDGYVPSETITHRALDAVELGRLSEAGLVQLLLGHTKMDSTVRYLGVELEDALVIAEAIEI